MKTITLLMKFATRVQQNKECHLIEKIWRLNDKWAQYYKDIIEGWKYSCWRQRALLLSTENIMLSQRVLTILSKTLTKEYIDHEIDWHNH